MFTLLLLYALMGRYDAVYDELRDDPDNNRANRIIADFDEAVGSIVDLILDMDGDVE